MDNEYDLTFQLLYPLRLVKKYTCIWIIIRNESAALSLKPTCAVYGDIALSLPMHSLPFHLKLKLCWPVDCIGNTNWHACS